MKSLKLSKSGIARTIPVVVALLMVLPGATRAQTGTGTVTGAVRDSAKAVIPNARVTITNPKINISRATESNGEGVYTSAHCRWAATR